MRSAELLALLLLAFQVLVPMCVAAFVDSPPLVATLSFFVCLGYTALNEAARELELPFGLGANHLPVVSYQEAFNSKISRLLDLNHPELGYLPTSASASHKPPAGQLLREHVPRLHVDSLPPLRTAAVEPPMGFDGVALPGKPTVV